MKTDLPPGFGGALKAEMTIVSEKVGLRAKKITRNKDIT